MIPITRSKAAILGFVITLAGTARATPNFPPAIQQDLSLAAEPHCSLCHSDGDQGGLGTVNTPFGKNMRQRGLVHFDTNALKNALDQMTSGHVNSAGDCLDDIDELKAGRDPNVPDPTCPDGGGGMITPTEGGGPSYGCAGRVAPRPGGGIAEFALAVMVLALGRRRRQLVPSLREGKGEGDVRT